MGRQGKEIVKANVSEVISDLLKAYADEWLAHYQYWGCRHVAERC
jgi:bacterioferritin